MISQYMDERVNDLRTLVPKALRDFDEHAIHQSRVATRRLTAAVRLLQPVLSESHRRPFEKVLRKLRRRLGPLRDLDVILGHLDELPECKKFPGAVDWVRAKLKQQRDELRQAIDEKIVGKTLSKLGSWWAVHDEVDEAAEATESLLRESVFNQLDAFAEQSDRLTGEKTPDPDAALQDPHELRIAGKALRYTLELAVAAGRPLPDSVLKQFKQMQQSLGDWHDMVVFSESVQRASLEAELALHDAKLAGQILDLAKATLIKSAKSMDKFAAQWKKHGAGLSQLIRETFEAKAHVPDVKDATPPQTDRDPAATDAEADQDAPPPADREGA